MARSPRRILSLIVALAVSALLAGAAYANNPLGSVTASLIGGNCGSTQPVFAPWGDPNQYSLVNDGDLASGSLGWTLTGGSELVPGGVPFNIPGASDTSSLLIPSGASALSPATCFGLLTPNIRLFARSAGSSPATIHVEVIATGLLGGLSELDGGTATVGTTWAPSPVFSTLSSQLNALVGAKTIQIQITTTGNVQIDDIYIDPFVSH